LVLTSAVSLMLIWAYQLVTSVTILDNQYLIFAVLTVLLSFLFLNKRLLMIFLPLFFVSLFFINNIGITYIEIVSALALGVFSHVVLDSFSPSGIKIFAPLSSKKVYKQFGLISIFVLILIAIGYHAPFLFNIFEKYVLHVHS
ncbi:MAG: metal-dependent hydrolase, partial [Methanobrevibacter sp.]